MCIEKDKILKTFFNFESMVDYNAEYKCLLWSVHPVILNFDVMRKWAFKLDGIMDSSQQSNEVIDHDDFWQHVDKSCIDQHSNANKIMPSLGIWDPWIPAKTRLNALRLNELSDAGNQFASAQDKAHSLKKAPHPR